MSELILRESPGVSVFGSIESFEQAQRMVQPLMLSTMVPDAYKNNKANCMVAMEMAHRINKSILEVMQNMQIVKGNAGWKSEYVILCINRSGLFKDSLEFEFSEDRTSCFAYATKKNGKKLQGTAVTMEMARAEGWLTKNGSKWVTMPEQMLMYRAATFFCRTYCPEVLAGVQTAEEIVDIGHTEITKSSAIEDFNDKIAPSVDHAEHVEFEEVKPEVAVIVDENELTAAGAESELEVTHEVVSEETDLDFEPAIIGVETIQETEDEDDDF